MVMHITDVDPLHLLLKKSEMLENILPCGLKRDRQVVGYCQALFSFNGNSGRHTEKVTTSLILTGSEFAKSHELFLGHQGNLPFCKWFAVAAHSLTQKNDGCVPVLITGLSPGNEKLSEIFAHAHILGEPVLVRILPGEDIEALTTLMSNVVGKTISGNMPSFYPLLQASGNTDLAYWQIVARSLGDLWQYTAIAVDPFVSREVCEFVKWQRVVNQVYFGVLDDIGSESYDISISGGHISLYPERRSYNLLDYVTSWPRDKKDIVIFIGPSQDWDDDYNVTRIKKVRIMMAKLGIST